MLAPCCSKRSKNFSSRGKSRNTAGTLTKGLGEVNRATGFAASPAVDSGRGAPIRCGRDLRMADFFPAPSGFLVRLLLQLPALLLAVTIHELAHGLVADRLGDPTARLSGRLPLNPLPPIAPRGALALVLVGFGWAKPVPVNAYNLRHPVRDMAAIAAAGPLANFVVAFVGILAYRLLVPVTALPAIVAAPSGGTYRKR